MQENYLIEQHQQVKNQELEQGDKPELKNGNSYTKRYILHFNKEIAEKIRLFCEVFFLNTSYFIEKTVATELFSIQCDLEGDLDMFIGYFDTSKLRGDPNKLPKQKVTKNNCEIECELHPLIAKPIEELCEKIHWTPEEFIANVMRYKMIHIFNDLKKGENEFITIYFDLKQISKSIDDIYYNKLI